MTASSSCPSSAAADPNQRGTSKRQPEPITPLSVQRQAINADRIPEKAQLAPLPLDQPDDDLSTIQALPSETDHSIASSSQVGAYAVGSRAPAARMVLATLTRPTEEEAEDLEAPSPLDLYNPQDTLIEAHLVHEQEQPAELEHNHSATCSNSDVVHAEKLTHPDSRRRAHTLLLAVACMVIAVLVVIVVVLLVVIKKDGDGSKDSSEVVGTALDAPFTSATTLDSPTTAATPTNSTFPRCFETTEELYHAATTYLHNPTPNSTIAQHYGHPIGSWCVSNLRRLEFVLKAVRDRYKVNTTTPTTTSMPVDSPVFANFHYYIGGWDMSNARNLEELFAGQQNVTTSWGIDQWDIAQTTSLKFAFQDTTWNQPALNLSTWNTSQVKNMWGLFQNSNMEAPGVANWDTTRVEAFLEFADGAKNFNENIAHWNVQKVVNMQSMFRNANNFNQDISQWKTSSLIKLSATFLNATKFNQPLGQWDISKVVTIRATFKGSAFDQDLSLWNTSSVTTIRQTFQDNLAFNQPLDMWDVSQVNDARWMFLRATNFSQDLCSWGQQWLHGGVLVDQMFKDTNCPNTSDPILEEGGPFCFNCN